jgi:uncharacterized repeat protein (TIGR03803 family)
MRNVRARSEMLIPSMGVVFALAIALAVAATPSAQAQTYTVLYSFAGSVSNADGAEPASGLVEDGAGNLYGTTLYGGTGLFGCPFGCGTVFKVNTAGSETVLHSFGETAADGESPEYGYLVRDGSGNLYGTTSYGGADDSGTIFRLSASGQETVLPFGGGAHGAFPYAGLVPDTAGNGYGTTYLRGSGCPPYGCGTVYKVSSAGKESVLYSFTGPPDGEWPKSGLVWNSSGNLYGTTQYGGANGDGTVFEVTATGKETVLYSFCSQAGCVDGAYPYSGLVQDSAGNLYGTTVNGGANGAGTVFEVATTGKETVLYSFCSQSGCVDGAYPYSALVRDSSGNLYGTTQYGGANSADAGTIFEVTAAGKETVLYSFCSQPGCVDGSYTGAGLLRDSTGTLYGTTFYGGAHGDGTVFKLVP